MPTCGIFTTVKPITKERFLGRKLNKRNIWFRMFKVPMGSSCYQFRRLVEHIKIVVVYY